MTILTCFNNFLIKLTFCNILATHFVDGHHVKSLDKLNRDLSKVIVIDWNPHSTKFHPENAFNISRWTGNDDDTTLFDLTAFLKSLYIFGGFVFVYI